VIDPTAAVEWATATGPPNWLFVLALLTHPKTWSGAAVQMVRRRFVNNESAEGATDE